MKTYKDVGLAMNLSPRSRSRVSALLRDTLPVNEGQARALLTALGGTDADIRHGLNLYRLARDKPADKPQYARPSNQVGRPIADYAADPRRLGIHEAIDLGDDPAGRSFLPLYVPRPHDEQLAEMVDRADGRTSDLAVLVGGSSTGKTRACWEAVRGLGEPWRLWYPFNPGAVEALLADLHRVGPHTVIWLNDAQHYLRPAGTGERFAAGLQELLEDRSRGPVLVLGTIWPKYWNELTADAVDGEDDPHAQARWLLVGRELVIPRRFSGADLDLLSGLADQDPRLHQALTEAANGQVTQYLAGVPALVRHYRAAPATAAAVIHAAMDARRLGVRAATLPRAFLAAAAPSYVTDAEWSAADEDSWLDEALAYTGLPCHGVPGPLTLDKSRIRRPAQREGRYRLADYLEQLGSSERAAELPPTSFWTAARDTLDGSDQVALARAAEARGLYRCGAKLFKHAIASGATRAAASLLDLVGTVDPAAADDVARWLVEHASWSDANDVSRMDRYLREHGPAHLTAPLLMRAAHQIELDDPYNVGFFLQTVREDQAAVANFLARPIGTSVGVSKLRETANLVRELKALGADRHADTLAARIAAQLGPSDASFANLLGKLGYPTLQTNVLVRIAGQVDPADIYTLYQLVRQLRDAQLAESRELVIRRISDADVVNTVALDQRELFDLLQMLTEYGADDQLAELASRLRCHAANAPPSWAAFLHMMSAKLSINDQLRSFLPEPPRPGALDLADHDSVQWFVSARWDAGDQAAIAEFEELLTSKALAPEAGTDPQSLLNFLGLASTSLLVRLAAEMPLGRPRVVAWLLREFQRRAADPGIGELLARSPAAAVDLDGVDAGAIASLLAVLRELGQHEQIAVLVGRQPASRVSIASSPGFDFAMTELALPEAGPGLLLRVPADAADSAYPVRALLRAFAAVDATDELAVFSGRAAGEVSFADAWDVSVLLETFRELSLTSAIAQLVSRDPATNLGFGDSSPDRNTWTMLLVALKAAGYEDQVATMATRMAAHADLSVRSTTAKWADAMRAAGAQDQALHLARRAADSGHFDAFLEIDRGSAGRYRYGREPNWTSSPPWTWSDLDSD
jgi:hypothetical protein